MSPELIAVLGVNVTVLLAQGAIWYRVGRLEGKLLSHLNHRLEDHDGHRHRHSQPLEP